MNLSEEKFQLLANNGQVTDARKGGLVLGKSHEQGGIYILIKNDSGGYSVEGEMEGWEYVLSREATKRNSYRIKEINESNELDHSKFKEYNIPLGITILDLRGKIFQLLYFEKGQSIINKMSSKYSLQELEEINKIK